MITYRSTRGGADVDLVEALSAGIAPDGGLFIPTTLPRLGLASFEGATSAQEIARVLLAPYFKGSQLEACLTDICAETFTFPLPLIEISARSQGGALAVLELFHGPTAAFKDVGARFLASALSKLQRSVQGSDRPILILVATSGDTGGAVAAAFHQRPGFEVAVLFPLERVSARQQQQLTCWGDNVSSFGVRGTFDDCQRMVKAAFVDSALASRYRLSSANSINIGRLLPQSVYYAVSSLEHWRKSGATLNYIIPTGNLGNGLAALLARSIGLPIGDIVFATNANCTIPDYLETGEYQGRESIATLANAMDVGDPSNIERLRGLFGEATELRDLLTAESVSDEQIAQRIADDFRQSGNVWCPHTATAMHVYRNLPDRVREQGDWAVVATAHPAKFDSIVEPLVGETIPLPPALSSLLDRPQEFQELAPTLDALAAGLSAR